MRKSNLDRATDFTTLKEIPFVVIRDGKPFPRECLEWSVKRKGKGDDEYEEKDKGGDSSEDGGGDSDE